MTRRVIARLVLPLDMGTVGRVLKALSADYPDATVDESFSVSADPDIPKSERVRLARERRKAAA